MVPMAEQLYNTRRLPTDDVEDLYYENMDEIGVMPSKHLRACYTCAVNIVNGQFYYYWSRLVGTGICGKILVVIMREQDILNSLAVFR
jgi:hypothetical protein